MRLPNRFSIFFIVLTAILLPAMASAGCGSPPDPRYNTSGYASWCSCMGGQYNYQTTACVGARTSEPESSVSSSSWYCQARAKNGAWGWGSEYSSRSSALERAMHECHIRSRGQRCYLQYCKTGQTAPTENSTSRIAAPTTHSRKALYDCSLCYRKLIADVRTGKHSSSIHTYVTHALAGYANCVQKARGSCSEGDILVRSLHSCDSYHTSEAYRACVERVVD